MKFELYKDKGGQWQWRLKASNGKTIADSGEGYSSKQGATDGIALVKGCANAPVVEV